VRIERLYIAGWMPFAGEHDIVLPAGPIAVVGEHNGDPRRSNRAGKTALLEAITWCLFGVHRKRLDDAIINRGADLCEVTVDLGGLGVTRSRARGKGSTKLQVNLGGTSLVGESAQAKVNEHLGLGLDDYLATACFRQGDVESIVSRTAGDRLALVSEWLQLGRWAVAKKVQAAKVNAADAALGAKRSSLATLEATTLTEARRLELQETETRLTADGERGQRRLASMQARSGEAANARIALEQHLEIENLRTRAGELRTQLAGKRAADGETEAKLRAVEEAAQAEQAARKLVDEVATIASSGFDGICPVMCEACPVAPDVEAAVRSNTELYEVRSKEMRACSATTRERRGDAVLARAASTQLDRASAEYAEIVRRGKELAASVVLSVDEATERLKDGETIEAGFAEAQAEVSAAAVQLGNVQRLLSASVESELQCRALRDSVAILEESARVSSLALRAICQVPADIARDELIVLEADANHLLQGTGVSLRFSWARELAEKSPACDECGHVFASKRGDACPRCSAARGKKRAQELEILCDDGSGLEEDVRFNSGGTRAIVGASIRLAASALLRRLRGAPAAWAIVDEPFGPLDSENREQLARSFAGMLNSVGLEQALVVSHDMVLLSGLPSKLVINKTGSGSKIRLEM